MSKLPDFMEEKLFQVARVHNGVVVVLGVTFFGLFFATLFHIGREHAGHENDPHQIIWMAPVYLIIVIYFVLLFWFVEWNDRRVCRSIGFVCKACGEPLYRPGSIYGNGPLVQDTGLCPRCGTKIVSGVLTLD